jgi:hypothetical protein
VDAVTRAVRLRRRGLAGVRALSARARAGSAAARGGGEPTGSARRRHLP